MLAPQLPPPVYHSAAAASTAAPGLNPEAVPGASAAPEAERELWEMELRAQACGNWSSPAARGEFLGSPGYPKPHTSPSAAFARGGDTRCPELTRKGEGEPWLRSATVAARNRLACISCDPTVCVGLTKSRSAPLRCAAPNCQLSTADAMESVY